MRKWPTAISSGPVTYCIDGVERHPSPKIVKWIKLQRMNHFLMYLKNETFSSLIHGQNVCTVVIPQNEFPKCSHNAIRETALFECREPNTMDQLIPKLALIAVFLHLQSSGGGGGWKLKIGVFRHYSLTIRECVVWVLLQRHAQLENTAKKMTLSKNCKIPLLCIKGYKLQMVWYTTIQFFLQFWQVNIGAGTRRHQLSWALQRVHENQGFFFQKGGC